MRLVPGLLALFLICTARGVGAQTPSDSTAVTLQPGDVVKVQIWREPDLSGNFVVDAHGVVTLPLLGERRVSDIPLEDLRQVLSDEYRVHLRNPSINIVPLRNLLVLGRVRSPGPYEVSPLETIIGVIAHAGGIDDDGNLRRVSIVRDGVTVEKEVPIASSIGSLGVRSGDQLMVGQRSWLARNQTLVISVLLALPSAVFTITRIVE